MDLSLPVTLVFDYPTASAIATFISELLVPADQPLPSSMISGPSSHSDTRRHDFVSVSSMSALVPGGAPSMVSTVLVDGVGSIPTERWDAELQLTQV